MSQAGFVSPTRAFARAVRDLARRARALGASLGDESPNSLMAYAVMLDDYAALLEAEAAKAASAT
jgi:hypothetical protein